MLHWKLILVLVLAGLVCSAPLLQYEKQTINKPELRKREEACSIEGNDDFYGLGIRVGIYLQWISTIIANHFLKDAIGGSLVTNTIFLLALIIAMVAAASEDTIEAAEIAILLQLCFGFLFSVLSIWGIRTRDRAREKPVRFPLVGAMARLTLSTAVCAYGVWFWLADDAPAAAARASDDCTQYIFLFAKLDMSGGVRIFYAIQSIAVLACFAWLNINEVIMLACFIAYTIIWTTVLAFLLIFWQAAQFLHDRDGRRDLIQMRISGLPPHRNVRSLLKILVEVFGRLPYLFYYSSSFAWQALNGKGSAGSDRPRLDIHVYLVINTMIFCFRSTVQYWCLVFFGKGPSAAFIPMFNARYWLVLRRLSRLRNLVEKGPAQVRRLLWMINIICIVWAIVSVEVTLVWNNITGIYQINTPGQLIPFIIGVVGIFQVVHGISVQRSDIGITEALLGLFDIGALQMNDDDDKSSSDSSSSWSTERGRPRSRDPRGQARSASICSRKTPIISRSVSRAKSETDCWELWDDRTWPHSAFLDARQWHHWVSFTSLEKHYYDEANLELYEPSNTSPFLIVKDYRRPREEYHPPENRPRRSANMDERRCFSLPPPRTHSSLVSEDSTDCDASDSSDVSDIGPGPTRRILRRFYIDIPRKIIEQTWQHSLFWANSTMYWFERILLALVNVCDERLSAGNGLDTATVYKPPCRKDFDALFRELHINLKHPVDIMTYNDPIGPILWSLLTRMTCQKAPGEAQGIQHIMDMFNDDTRGWPEAEELNNRLQTLITPDYKGPGTAVWEEVLVTSLSSTKNHSEEAEKARSEETDETLADATGTLHRQSLAREREESTSGVDNTDGSFTANPENALVVFRGDREAASTDSSPSDASVPRAMNKTPYSNILLLLLVLGTCLKIKAPWRFRARWLHGRSDDDSDRWELKSAWLRSAAEAIAFCASIFSLAFVLRVIQQQSDEGRATRRRGRSGSESGSQSSSGSSSSSSGPTSSSSSDHDERSSSRSMERRWRTNKTMNFVLTKQSPGALILRLVTFLQHFLEKIEARASSRRMHSLHEFLREARKVRLWRTTHEIGKTAQHEMIQQLWRRYIGQQYFKDLFQDLFEDLRHGVNWDELLPRARKDADVETITNSDESGAARSGTRSSSSSIAPS